MYCPCADPGRGGQGVQNPSPGKSQRYNRVPYQYWSGSPEKSHSYQASIQYFAIIGMPAKRYSNYSSLLVVLIGPLLVVFGSSLPLFP